MARTRPHTHFGRPFPVEFQKTMDKFRDDMFKGLKPSIHEDMTELGLWVVVSDIASEKVRMMSKTQNMDKDYDSEHNYQTFREMILRDMQIANKGEVLDYFEHLVLARDRRRMDDAEKTPDISNI